MEAKLKAVCRDSNLPASFLSKDGMRAVAYMTKLGQNAIEPLVVVQISLVLGSSRLCMSGWSLLCSMPLMDVSEFTPHCS